MAIIPPNIFTDAEALNNFFDPDNFVSPVLGVAAKYSSRDPNTPRSGLHSHSKGQLIFTRQGSTSIELVDKVCVIQPSRAVWIPAHTPHKTTQASSVEFRSIYLSADFFPQLSSDMEIISLSPLLKEILESVAYADFATNWLSGRQYNILKVLLDELRAAPRDRMSLPLPRDYRMAPLLQLLRQRELPPRLAELATRIGASERTICRIFVKETGMNYQCWRQQWRLMRSIELMSGRKSVSEIANILDFTSDSAFVAFFKQHIGTTPGRYIQEIQGAARR